MLERSAAEAGVCLLTSLLIAAALGRGLRGNVQADELPVPPSTLLSLIILTVAITFLEQQFGPKLGAKHRQRAAASTGLAVGTLALPWLFAGLTARQHAAGLPSAAAAAALHTCLAASAAATLLLLRSCGILGQPRATRERNQMHEAERSGWPQQSMPWWARWVLLAALAAVALQAAAAGAALGVLGAARLAGTAAAACACLLALLAGLPRTFTIGEALVAAQAVALLGSTALQQLPSQLLWSSSGSQAAESVDSTAPGERFVLLLTAGSVLGSALLFPPLLALQQQTKRKESAASSHHRGVNGSHQLPGLPPAAVATAAVAALAAAAAMPAALWALRYGVSTRRRLLLLCWWAAALAAALPAMGWLNRSGRVPSILVRKGYHLLAVALFLPALLLEPQLLGVALAGAFLALLVVEAARLSGLPGIAPRIHAFMASFTDARDSGPVLITHFTLLLGMAAPVWLSNALLPGTLGAAAAGTGARAAGLQGQQQAVWLAGYAGIMILGFGDTAASAVGSLLGRRRICRGSKKTVEGTAAAAAATLAAWWLLAGALPTSSGSNGSAALGTASWPALAAATVLSCLLEAATTQLDNIFMPLHYFALLCLL